VASAEARAYMHQLYTHDFIEVVFNQGQAEAIDALVSADFIDHNPVQGQPPTQASIKALVRGLHTAFPDLRFSVEDVMVDGDQVVGRWRMQGTNTGVFLGRPPTGKVVDITGIDILRVTRGKIAELWYNVDELGLLRQLGLVPVPSHG
jgi:steroid delta-isomerase-like uncharacterized protein